MQSYLGNEFQSTPSAWRETYSETLASPENLFQSTPSAWRETHHPEEDHATSGISIHSLRMEGDRPVPPPKKSSTPISIHSLRMEGDHSAVYAVFQRKKHFNPLPPHGGRRSERTQRGRLFVFQSTPSAWRETSPLAFRKKAACYFNPLPPHGGRPAIKIINGLRNQFQSTPSAWRETPFFLSCRHRYLFQSTPSAWRETIQLEGTCDSIAISIHSLRMEGDRDRAGGAESPGAFQSTPSAWRETGIVPVELKAPGHFNPLPPHGGRRNGRNIFLTGGKFQSTPSAWRETDFKAVATRGGTFQSTPSAWRETQG